MNSNTTIGITQFVVGMVMIHLLIVSLSNIYTNALTVMKNRHVVRENRAFEMECIHNLENLTRVRWEYISTHDIVNRTIYDSQQPNNTLKSGFEVSCQPHEAFISTCILKLVHARKEDSGKYICYVGEENEANFDSNLLKPITEVELVIRGPLNQTVVVSRDDSVTLQCEHNIRNLTRARWSHVSMQGFLTYNLYYLNAKDATTGDNYKILCKLHQLSCNLKILQANKESAGRYICMVGESLEFEEKYGLDQMTHFIEIELVVGELECNENMNKDLTLIGENDCHRIEADVLNLKCSFNYFGNINYKLLHLRWIQKHKFNSLEKILNSSLIKHEVKDETNKISIQTNLSVAYEMQNSIFQCVLDDTAVNTCHLNEFRTQYIKNTTERSPPIHSNDLHNMKCSANKSANVQCSYYWVHEIAGAMVENPYAILPIEHMNSPGIYTCLAKCHLGVQKECIIKAMEVEIILGSEAKVSDSSHSINWVIVLAVAVIILLLITFATCGCLVFLRWKYKNYKKKYELELMQNKSVPGEDKTSSEQANASLLSPEPDSMTTNGDLKVQYAEGGNCVKMFVKQLAKALAKSFTDVPYLLILESIKKQLIKMQELGCRYFLAKGKNDKPDAVLKATDNDDATMKTNRNNSEVLESKDISNTGKCGEKEIQGGKIFGILKQNPGNELDTKENFEKQDIFERENEKKKETSDITEHQMQNPFEDVLGTDEVLGKNEKNFDIDKKVKDEFLSETEFGTNLGIEDEIDFQINNPSEYMLGIVELNIKKNSEELEEIFDKDSKWEMEIGGKIDLKVQKLIEGETFTTDEVPFKNEGDFDIKDIVNPLCPLSKSQRRDDSSQLGKPASLQCLRRRALKSECDPHASSSDKSSTPRKEDQAEGDKIEVKFIPLRPLPKFRLLDDSSQLESSSTQIKLSQLLRRGKMLQEEKTQYHIIRIYETLLTGKVMMIDGTVCEAEDDATSEQKEVATLPFKSHPNPKNVLIIGGYYAGIVHEMLKNPEVESIILYEIDEQLLALYRKYFPSLACSLDDPRVKVIIGDGNEFLKKQKNAFDVIISCSTNLCDSALDLISKKYYEIVKSALKDGGVTSSIFHGESFWYFDDIKRLVMKYCNQQFPVVKYLEVPDHKFSNYEIGCFLYSLNPAHSPLSSLSSGYASNASSSDKSSTPRKEDQAEATGKKISLSQFLRGGRMLHEDKTKYHNIRIYETLLSGKVMMVDGAVCEAEDDATSEQKEIAILPFKSHPNPKDVLIIGGGCVGIVHEMLKDPEVESIILHEIDEQLLALYHIYFPSLACSLDDPRVKVIIGDGNEFLKKQKNAFDVIINCSTNLCDLALDLISNEYCEIVKSALKDGGVTSLMFHGESFWHFDGIKGLVMKYCNQQFPVVKYLEAPDHKLSNRKIRCFLCSLNPETKFEVRT